MDVTIEERKISFTSEYDIATPTDNYNARKAILALNDSIEVTKEGGAVAAHIQGHFSPLRSKHDITMTDGRAYAFECEKLLTRVFKCEGGSDAYTLYEHRGLKFSIFKGDVQIAAFTKNLMVIGSGNEYQVRMNSDADVLLIVCMVIAINSIEFNDDSQTVNFDFGNIGPQGRVFDESWEPR
jgi:uncharacterized protein YxjI